MSFILHTRDVPTDKEYAREFEEEMRKEKERLALNQEEDIADSDDSASRQSTLVEEDDAIGGEEVFYEDAAIIPRRFLPTLEPKPARKPKAKAHIAGIANITDFTIRTNTAYMDTKKGNMAEKRDEEFYRERVVLKSDDLHRGDEDMTQVRDRVLTFDPDVLVTQEGKAETQPTDLDPSGKKKRKNHRSKRKKTKPSTGEDDASDALLEGLSKPQATLLKQLESKELTVAQFVAKMNNAEKRRYTWVRDEKCSRGYRREELRGATVPKKAPAPARKEESVDEMFKRMVMSGQMKVETTTTISYEDATPENRAPLTTNTISSGIPGTAGYRELRNSYEDFIPSPKKPAVEAAPTLSDRVEDAVWIARDVLKGVRHSGKHK